MKTDFDPYDMLLRVDDWSKVADTHLTNILNNEKQIINAVNSLSKDITQLKDRIKLIEGVINEIARTQ